MGESTEYVNKINKKYRRLTLEDESNMNKEPDKKRGIFHICLRSLFSGFYATALHASAHFKHASAHF